MSILKWFGTSRILIGKDKTPITSVRRFCTEKSDEPTKSKLDLIIEEREQIDLDTKLRYMKSKAYKKTYGDLPVWAVYVRNFKGAFPPRPRKNCVWGRKLSTRNPCPICRDKYLVADYRNLDLLKQFIAPNSGEVISNRKTGICQKQHLNILIALQKAKDMGLLSFPIPFREYDYSLYQK